MNYHPTPPHIANIIKRHLPKSPNRILEPAAGEGALINPLPKSTLNSSRLTIIDIDPEKCKILSFEYGDQNIINEDFISWAKNNPRRKFDLILTNPPFSGRPENWIEFDDEKTPIEVAFLSLAISKLAYKGTMIAIVPDSIVRSARWSHFRKNLYNTCSVTHSYQLPERSFGSIEGIFFLLVIKNSARTKKISLRKFYREEESLDIKFSQLKANNYRLDFDYYRSSIDQLSLYQNIKQKLIKVDNIFVNAVRGSVRSNYKDEGLLHTTSFRELNYGIDTPFHNEYYENSSDYLVAVKRVSRNSHMTFGLISRSKINNCTDCLILFCSDKYSPIELLFYLRVVFSNEIGKSILLKGTGAKYISVKEIQNLPFFEIHKLNIALYDEYEKNYLCGNFKSCLIIEKKMLRHLIYGNNVSSISKLSRHANYKSLSYKTMAK